MILKSTPFIGSSEWMGTDTILYCFLNYTVDFKAMKRVIERVSDENGRDERSYLYKFS